MCYHINMINANPTRGIRKFEKSLLMLITIFKVSNNVSGLTYYETSFFGDLS